MLTLDIRHIHYTALLHALATAACRHAERAGGRQAEILYSITRELNDIGRDIQANGLTELLNSPLPLPASIAPIIEHDHNSAKGQILNLLANHPGGLTNHELTEHIDKETSTIYKAADELTEEGALTCTLIGKTKHYTLAASPAAAQAANAQPQPTIDQQLIAALARTSGLTGLQLAEQLGIDASTVHKHLKPLIEDRVIVRTNNRQPFTYARAVDKPKPTHPALTGRDSAPDRIIHALLSAGAHGLTSKELVAAIHYSYGVTITSVNRLIKAGHIHRSQTQPTRYSLAQAQPQAHAAD